MRILDRYILKSILSIFLSTIIIFSLLYVLVDIAANLDNLLDRKVPFAVLAQYYLSFLPIILVQTSPIACLIATLFTYSQLNHSNEIIALRTSGLNFWKIAKPALSVAVTVAAFIFLLNEKLVPQSEVQSEQIRDENMIIALDTQRKTQAKIKNLTFYGLKNRLYFIDQFDPNTYEIDGITVVGFDDRQDIKEKIVALKGRWTGIAWEFSQCQVSTFNETDFQAPIKVKIYQSKLMDIKETPKDFLRQRLNVTSMNIRQLKEYIAKFSSSGATKAINNLRVDLYQKYAYPTGCIIIILVGLPLAMITGRRKALTFSSLGIAVLIGFLYYVCNAVGLALGKGGLFPPLLAAWLTPFIFSFVAWYLIKTKFA